MFKMIIDAFYGFNQHTIEQFQTENLISIIIKMIV